MPAVIHPVQDSRLTRLAPDPVAKDAYAGDEHGSQDPHASRSGIHVRGPIPSAHPVTSGIAQTTQSDRRQRTHLPGCCSKPRDPSSPDTAAFASPTLTQATWDTHSTQNGRPREPIKKLITLSSTVGCWSFIDADLPDRVQEQASYRVATT
jgi:hypothetical protein